MSVLTVQEFAPRVTTLPRMAPHVAPCEALSRDLGELAELVERLSDNAYAAKPVGVFESSVGEHVRHSLDHVTAFLEGVAFGRINYDLRRRGTDVETCRSAALGAICDLQLRLDSLSHEPLERLVRLNVMMAPTGPTAVILSSVGRELAFVLSHTTHHKAIIAAMTRTMAVETPEEFGVAPSTAAYRRERPCVR